MNKFQEIAEDLAGKTDAFHSWGKEWEQVWLHSGSAFPGIEAFVRFAKCFTSLEQWTDFHDRIKNEVHLKNFLTAVDASFHPPEQWLAALEVIGIWSKQNNRTISPEQCISYLSCCAQAISPSSPGIDLAEVTDEMLRHYGMD